MSFSASSDSSHAMPLSTSSQATPLSTPSKPTLLSTPSRGTPLSTPSQGTPLSTPTSSPNPSANSPPCCSSKLETGDEAPSPTDRFTRWRPSYHFQPRTGWMNDPCAPYYNPSTNLYHLSFQWNPDSSDWANISWGSATSKDMVTWDFVDEPTIVPDKPYDQHGIFTGCMIPALTGNGAELTCVYTSVSSLPIHYTVPHPRGCESLSMAKSNDGGRSWAKCSDNPILPGEPEGLDVCGWRDPFVAKWPRVAQVLRRDPDQTLFAVISGGIVGVTPTAFLYAMHVDHPSEWEYLGPLFCGKQNIQLSRWSGDLGKNWEVANFVTLTDDGDDSVSRDFLIVGTEGCLPFEHRIAPEPNAPGRPLRGQLWISGALKEAASGKYDSQVEMQYEFGGHLDHGLFYAANSFYDFSTRKHIVWGWITEEDISEKLRQRQGWAGLLSLPRELSLQTIRHVVNASSSDLSSITSIEKEEDGHGSFTIRTLVTQPVASVIEKLRLRASKYQIERIPLTPNYNFTDLAFTSTQISTSAWELDCVFELLRNCAEVGLSLVHSKDSFSSTILTFSPSKEEVTISRPPYTSPDLDETVDSSTERAPHTLFTTKDPVSGTVDTEKLHVRVWRDSSVLEVFVNQRTAISTRIYGAESTLGIAFFARSQLKEQISSARLISATLWDGIGIPQ